MKEDFIRRRLGEMPTPAASESARDKARYHALIAFQQARSLAPESPESKRAFWASYWSRLGVSALIALSAILISVLLRPQATAENVATDRQMLQQMEKLFPQQLDSVVEEHGKIDLSVASSAMVGADQPIVVIFRKPGDSIRVLSYSGHHVCVALGQEHRCFDILATPTGGVILVTDKEVVTTQGKARPIVAGYTVQALTLEASL